ncbi:MAG: hypothetical protein GC160_16465 [Acidobacteria bacterium]|nr:hypothetical protein [Acidobacteriota bacterium]
MRRLTAVAILWAAALAAAEAPGPQVDRMLVKLLDIRTLYVEPLQGEAAGTIRDMLVGAIQKTGLFVLTENPDTADAFLRGSAEDLIYQNLERRRESLTARGSASGSRRETGDSRYNAASFGVGDSESSELRERRHEASAAVRILLPNGEVLWSTIQESDGAKFRGSAHDVAAKVADDLVRAYRKAQALDKP